jgi:DNA-binding transcriptional MerR regulator
MENRQWLWPFQIAKEVGVCSATVKRYAERGVIKCVRDAKGRRYFHAESIEILRRELGRDQEPPQEAPAA